MAVKFHKLNKHESDLVDAGLIVQAIKLVRQRLSFGLREAKELVDSYLYTNPRIANGIRKMYEMLCTKLGEIKENDDLRAMEQVNRKLGLMLGLKQEGRR